MPPPSPSASNISVEQTLALLDGPFAAVAAGVAENHYAFWLGSGISFGRVAGLSKVIERLLEFLCARIDGDNPACRFRRTFDDALNLASATPAERGRIDTGRPVAEWPDGQGIVRRLVTNYARLLDLAVEGEPDDYLLWEGVGVGATFADPSTEPDVEHLCMALLILEGSASEVASANWDPLVERAVERLTGGTPTLVVCVRPENLREPELAAYLYKFHGCALLASQDPDAYRSFLVARQSQINAWTSHPANAAIAARLVNLITAKPTLMLGLSAQDFNVQALFAMAEANLSWPWPGERPSFVFSENDLGVDQRSLLRNVYRTHHTPATRAGIEQGAVIKAYAKPLLLALVLHILGAKLCRLVDLAPGKLDGDDRARLKAGIVGLRDTLARLADGDRLTFVLQLVERMGKALELFRDGRPGPIPGRYSPLHDLPLHRLGSDRGLSASGLREVAVALGLLGIGLAEGEWTFDASDATDLAGGVLRIQASSGEAKILFAGSNDAAARLANNGHWIQDGSTIVIYSPEIAPRLQRSPVEPPGRTGRSPIREIGMATMLDEAANCNELMQLFREVVSV